jgi:hypothetical protein
MSLPIPARRRAALAGGAVFSAVALAAGLSAVGASAQVPRPSVPAGANPYAPAYQHPYRHGAVPTIGRLRLMRTWERQHPGARAASSTNLTYGGSFHGIGVTTGHEKVYLVFFGRQWGTKGTDGHGNVTLSGDPSGEAPYLQRLFKGLGTNNDLWSGVMTQYCDGAPVNAQSCAADTLHVGYPSGGALSGVWVDESSRAPSRPSAHLLAVEAVKAAKHFKNTTPGKNRNSQYVIISPTHTHPDGFPSTGFCAWHDWNGDRSLHGGGAAKSPYGPVAFTNLPYLTDAGLRCGLNFINAGAAGTLDGVSMVSGHEYAETITDQIPPAGWVNPSGEENGDLCAWNQGPGAPAADLALATGSFAMQSTWGNDGNLSAGTCEFSHAIVRNLGIFNGGFERGLQGWTTSGAVSIVHSGVHAGRSAARAGKPTPTKGNSRISQTFNANGAHLSFFFNMSCPDRVGQSWGTVTLTDNTAHSTVTLLAKRCIRHSGWRQVSHTVVAGHSYTLTLISHDDHDTRNRDGNFTLLDAVTDS